MDYKAAFYGVVIAFIAICAVNVIRGFGKVSRMSNRCKYELLNR